MILRFASIGIEVEGLVCPPWHWELATLMDGRMDL
jgi:hypothetical protein